MFYHAQEKCAKSEMRRARNPSTLTLLFSLCITPIIRTLMGYRWVSMMKRQTQNGLNSPVASCCRSRSVPALIWDCWADAFVLTPPAQVWLRVTQTYRGGKCRHPQESVRLLQKACLHSSNLQPLRQHVSWSYFVPKEISFGKKFSFCLQSR